MLASPARSLAPGDMHVGVIEDDGDQRALACMWLGQAGHVVPMNSS